MNRKNSINLLVMVIIFTAQSLFAQLLSRPKKLELSCKHVSPIEKSYLSRHVNIKSLNKSFEDHLSSQFIKKMDPAKIYLLKSDIKKIKTLFRGVVTKTKTRNCSPIEQAHELYKKRVKERVQFAQKYLAAKNFKFNKKTKLILDPDYRKAPFSLSAANSFHKKYIQFQIANYISADSTLKEAKEKVSKNYGRILRRVDDFKLTDLYALYVDSYAHAFDPHSSYLSAEVLEDFKISMSLSLEGIGATLSSKDGFTTIENLVPGGAAFKSGKLKTKDKIIAVAQGDKGKFDNVVEMDLRDVVKKIRGTKGTKVRLKIKRKTAGKSKTLDVTLVRDKIKLEDEAAQISYIDKKVNGVNKKIGLLYLPSFYASSSPGQGRSSSEDLKKLLKQAKKNSVDAVVLDLSTNGGGSLDAAVKISGLFFKTGNVVKQSNRDTKQPAIVLADTDKTVDYQGPLVILTSRISASASEIVSGTLQDYKRAIIVGGDHTFGKGTVQSVEPLPTGLGAIKTTVGMFYTAGGKSTQHRGVGADIRIPSAYSTDEIGENILDYSLKPDKLPSFLSPDAYVQEGDQAWKMVDQKLISYLAKKSKKRVKQSAKFKKLVRDINKSKKKKKWIVVGESLKEQEEAKGESEIECIKEANRSFAAQEIVNDELILEVKICKDPDHTLTKKEKHRKYLKRADVIEAIDIAVDFIEQNEKKSKIRVGSSK